MEEPWQACKQRASASNNTDEAAQEYETVEAAEIRWRDTAEAAAAESPQQKEQRASTSARAAMTQSLMDLRKNK